MPSALTKPSYSDIRQDYTVTTHTEDLREVKPISHPQLAKPSTSNLAARQASGAELRAHLSETGFLGAAEEKLRDADAWLKDNPSATAVSLLDYMAGAGALGHIQLGDSTLLRAGKWVYGDDFVLNKLSDVEVDHVAEIQRLNRRIEALEAENVRLRLSK
ncbi:MAG TPA: hypothetical protein VFE62_20585 [Gemmataceae bacterium]|nr:hypothetical protein [Gemmataceae bacterium]